MTLLSHPMFRRFAALVLLLVALVRCGSTPQHTTLPNRPNPWTADAATISIDTDAYNVALTPRGDGGLSLSGHGETITPLHTGQTAPYPGVLFNGPAVARIEVEFRSQGEQCRIDSQATLDRLRARALADVALLQTTLDAQNQTTALLVTNRNQEIDRLYQYIQTHQAPSTPAWETVLFALGGGFVLGAGLVGAAVILH